MATPVEICDETVSERGPKEQAQKPPQESFPNDAQNHDAAMATPVEICARSGHDNGSDDEAEASASSLVNASDLLLAVEAAVRAACGNPLLRSWRMGAPLLVPRSGAALASTLTEVLVVVELVAAVGVACGCAGSHCKRFPLGGLKANPPEGPTPRLRPRRRGGLLRKLLLNQDDCC